MVDRKWLADELERLCCAETEGKFFDLVTDSITEIIATLRGPGGDVQAPNKRMPEVYVMGRTRSIPNNSGCGWAPHESSGWEPEPKRPEAPVQAAQASPADAIIGDIEKRFPNWKSYRDLVDCIDCTLHHLREHK
jgi:hypothetical protein